MTQQGSSAARCSWAQREASHETKAAAHLLACLQEAGTRARLSAVLRLRHARRSSGSFWCHAPQAYAVSFFAIPLVRWLRNQRRNAAIEEENSRRREAAARLGAPRPALAAKLEVPPTYIKIYGFRSAVLIAIWSSSRETAAHLRVPQILLHCSRALAANKVDVIPNLLRSESPLPHSHDECSQATEVATEVEGACELHLPLRCVWAAGRHDMATSIGRHCEHQ